VSETPREAPGAAPSDDDAPPPGLQESLRQVGDAGKAALGSARDGGRALRTLLSADLALARSAFGRALAWAGVAIVFGASAWLLVAGALIALMQRFGFSWLQSLSLAAVVSLAATGLAAWQVTRYFDCMGLHATRRQLSRLGFFDEPSGDGHDDDDDAPDGGAPR